MLCATSKSGRSLSYTRSIRTPRDPIKPETWLLLTRRRGMNRVGLIRRDFVQNNDPSLVASPGNLARGRRSFLHDPEEQTGEFAGIGQEESHGSIRTRR